MTTTELKDLLKRVRAWPEAAQDELVAIAKQIESELQGGDYVATQEELRVIDAATASIDSGEAATDAEVAVSFCKVRVKLGPYSAVQPPSIDKLAPVIWAASSPHRNSARAATCSEVTNSLVGCASSSTSLMTCSLVMLRAFMVSGI